MKMILHAFTNKCKSIVKNFFIDKNKLETETGLEI